MNYYCPEQNQESIQHILLKPFFFNGNQFDMRDRSLQGINSVSVLIMKISALLKV